VIDLDAATVAVLRALRRQRGGDGAAAGPPRRAHLRRPRGRSPQPGARVAQFARDTARCRETLGEDALPPVRLHDLRHTHASLLLSAREPVHVVSQRLGHASAVVTMTVYAHVLPGSQREAADLFARLVREAGQ
jgi:integrase